MAESPTRAKPKLLVFGGRGAIGRAIQKEALSRGWDVVATSRNADKESCSHPTAQNRAIWLTLDPFSDVYCSSPLEANGPYSAVCWAQGANINDDIFTVDRVKHQELYEANCLFIVLTLQSLLKLDLLIRPARLCVVSSIWQNTARQNKLSYSMTKAALQGLVLSVTADLAVDGHLVNAVLPGALDTQMTRDNLLPSQIQQITSATKFDRLPTLSDTVSLILYLCSPENTGITGQFIAADLGFSHVRLI